MLELFKIDPARHDPAEVERRIHAAEYPGSPGAFLSVGGHEFYYPYETRRPIVD